MAKKISEQTIKELKEYFATFLKDAKARIKWATDDKIRDIQNTIRVENNKGTFWGHPEILARYEKTITEINSIDFKLLFDIICDFLRKEKGINIDTGWDFSFKLCHQNNVLGEIK